MTLLEQILRLARLWTDANGHRSLARLSTIVANDGGLLKRLDEGTGGTTVATLDKFACHLRDFANWPNETPPNEARELIDCLPHIATAPASDEPELPFSEAAAA
jgi:hypothetical protein